MEVMQLSASVGGLNKVGKAAETKLQRLQIFTIKDLLWYFPFRYEDYSRIVPIRDLVEGEQITIKATVELIANRRGRSRRTITQALVSDESGSIRIIWFNQPYLIKNLKQGDVVYFSGTVKRDMLGLQLVSPIYEFESTRNIHTAHLVPIYPTTGGLTQKQLRFLVKQCLPAKEQIVDWLPESVKEKYKLLDLPDAIVQIHFPDDQTKLNAATERLKFDELLLVQMRSELSRLENSLLKAPSLIFHEEEIKKFVASLPFTLTNSQKLAAWEILKNISETHPMNRLLSGDVGSGKTVVAALALYNTFLNGFQGVIMAPTEILAVQHYHSLKKFLPDLKIALLTASDKVFDGDEVKKPELLKNIEDGKANVIVGTHALLSEGVEFSKVGLVIVDEQHRFGVAQRKVIKEKGRGVHFLSMTATPIPRSLALMLYGDLEVSQIPELPPGRKPILTRLVEPKNRAKAYEFIRGEVKKGRQVFVICPLIENSSPTDEKKSVLSEFKKLSEQIFPDLKVGYLHGKLKKTKKGGEKSKEEVMEDFKNKKIDILVSTSVVEVGVDIPNASVMMVEGADRFGLAQLHQFRGRVGRGEHQSYCFLFADTETSRIIERLKFFEVHNNGFKLAEKDLELRGPGEVYGTAQSGMMQLRLAKLSDTEIIKKARLVARELAPEISKHPALQKKMKEWEESVHLE